MTIKDRQRVNNYLPDEHFEKDPGEVTPEGGLWQLVRKFGLGFNLALGLALAYQVFMAVFIALNGLKTVPLLADTSPIDHTRQFFTNTGAIVLAVILQGLLLVEIFLAIRLRPDTGDTPLDLDQPLTPGRPAEPDPDRPPHSTIWWGVVLGALVVTVALDLGLLFLSLTGKATLGAAWQTYRTTPTLGFLFLPAAILDLLTLFCGAILVQIASTKTSDDEDGFKAFAEAFLVGASGRLRAKVVKVWRKLGVDPLRFIPVNASTLKLLASKHPELTPPRSNADHWAYDFNGNMFALLPSDVHKALLQNIYRLGRDGEDIFDTDGTRLLWRQTASDMADMIARNIEIYGSPRFVDISNPNKPKILGGFGDLDARPGQSGKPLPRLSAPGKDPSTVVIEPLVASQYLSPNLAFATGLSPAERALFGSYLTNTVFPYARGTRYPADLPDMSIFEAFELEDMLWYYRYWKKQAGSRA
ncbi:MAG: hypothetical protein J0I20_07685 [Chloroflexi bacterium]|nr:hypothetical protein [Chloroflexota bacterium]OJV95297.1 MAG: hypothetical protein BGO39_25190 [Chloroflexi bacterium 54-19]